MPPKLTNSSIYIKGCEINGIPDFEVDSDTVTNALKQSCDVNLKDCILQACIKLDLMMFYKLIGLYDWVINNCPNRRVSHLIKHGKTRRVRNKNFKIALKLCGKE